MKQHLPVILILAGAAMQAYDAYSGGKLFGPNGALASVQTHLPGYQVDGVTPTIGFYLIGIGAAWMLLKG